MAINFSLNPEKVREQIRFAEMHENLNELKDIEKRVENFVKSNKFAFLENSYSQQWNDIFHDAKFTKIFVETHLMEHKLLAKELQKKIALSPSQPLNLKDIMIEARFVQLQFNLDRILEVEQRIRNFMDSAVLEPLDRKDWKKILEVIKHMVFTVETHLENKKALDKEYETKARQLPEENEQKDFRPLETIMTWFWGENWREIFEQKAQESQKILIKNLQEEGIDLDPYDSEQETIDSDSSTY